MFFVCGDPVVFAPFAAAARVRVGEELGLIDQGSFKFCWILDYPMYEMDEQTGKIDFSHNPFSMPQGGLEALNGENSLDVKAYQYDIV